MGVALGLQQRGFLAIFVGLQIADFQPPQVECVACLHPLKRMRSEAESRNLPSMDCIGILLAWPVLA